MHQWYHKLAHLFESEPDHHSAVAIDETKLKVEETEGYVWAALDVETFEVTAPRSCLADLTSMCCYSATKF